MATPLTLPHSGDAPGGRYAWLMVAIVLVMGAAGAGYGLAVGELQALWVALAVAACVAILIDYRLGTLLLIVLLPLSATSLFPHSLMKITGLNPLNLLLSGTLAAYLLRGRLEHPAPLVPRPVAWLYIAPIVVAGLLGSMHVDEIYAPFFDAAVVSFTDWKGYLRDQLVKPLLTVLAALLVGAAVAKGRKPEPFVMALLIGACVLAFVMLGFILAAGIGPKALASPRAREFFIDMGMHANTLGRLFVTAYALLLFSWWESKHPPTSLGLFAALGIVSLGILLTFSRNAFLGFFLVNALFLVWRFNAKKLAIAVLVIGIAVALAPEYIYQRITYGFDEDANAVSAGRVEGIWAPLLPEVLNAPLWGNGLGSIMWSHALTNGAMDAVTHPHNAYLEALLDMGLIGLAALLAYYWHVWKGFRALGSNAYLTPLVRGFFQGACAALIVFAVGGLSGGSLRPEPENMILWIAIGTMYGLLARKPAS